MDNETMCERIKRLREEQNISQEELAKKSGYSNRSTITKIEKGERKPTVDKIKSIANALKVTPAYLIGWEPDESDKKVLERYPDFIPYENNYLPINNEKSNLDTVSECLYNVPIFESASAGFGAAAINDIVDYIALPFRTKAEADETLCIRVKGDSMSPKIEDGDLIQVQKQTSVDSGDVAVVLIDGEEGLVKKVEYDKEYIKLISFNPYYPPIEFKGKDVLRISVVGKVKKIIRDL